MNLDKVIYRPPMEFDSLIVQVTTGCAHNKCTFCTMYKDRPFTIRSVEDIVEELKLARKQYKNTKIKKVFLADGDAFVIKTESILEILKNIKEIFPECDHVASYARFTDVARKSTEDLIKLKENGLTKLYLGLESGSQTILDLINKNSSPEIIVEGARRLKEAKITTYTTVLLGLGGKEYSKQHISETTELLNTINPDYISLMTLLVSDDMELQKDIKSGKFILLDNKELVGEALELVKNLELNNTTLRINHASNFVNLEGIMPESKDRIIKGLENALSLNLDSRNNLRRF